MSKNEKPSDAKLCYNILQNKLRNLKEYDSRYGTKILDSIGANIASVDDVLTKQLNGVSLSSCANNKYLANEVGTVTDLYSDLLTRIANNQSGCGMSLCDDDEKKKSTEFKELSKFKRDFITIIGKQAKRGRKKKSKVASKRMSPGSKRGFNTDLLSGEGMTSPSMSNMTASAKRRSKKKKASKKASKKTSKKLRSSHIFF